MLTFQCPHWFANKLPARKDPPTADEIEEPPRKKLKLESVSSEEVSKVANPPLVYQSFKFIQWLLLSWKAIWYLPPLVPVVPK